MQLVLDCPLFAEHVDNLVYINLVVIISAIRNRGLRRQPSIKLLNFLVFFQLLLLEYLVEILVILVFCLFLVLWLLFPLLLVLLLLDLNFHLFLVGQADLFDFCANSVLNLLLRSCHFG